MRVNSTHKMKSSFLVLVVWTAAASVGNATERQPELVRPRVQQGKLYFRSSQAELKGFRAKEEKDIVAANRNWLQLTH